MAEKGKFEQLVLHVHPIVKGRMTISIPEELFLRSATDDDLNIAWRNVLKSAHKFAEEYLKKTESPELKDPETG